MKKKRVRDPNEPVGSLRTVSDFLPAPEKLLPKEDTIKITIALDEETLRFFKAAASKMGLKYQRMMREVLKGYAQRYG